MPENEKLIEELNDLILINKDRIEKYKKILKDSHASEDIFLLKKMIDQSIHFNKELISEIKNKNHNQNWESVTKPGKIYKMWEDLILSIPDNKGWDILEKVENSFQKIYQKALSPEVYVPSDTIHLLIIQKAKLKELYQVLKSKQPLKLMLA